MASTRRSTSGGRTRANTAKAVQPGRGKQRDPAPVLDAPGRDGGATTERAAVGRGGAPRRRRTQAERSAGTRARLLGATIDSLYELGWAGTSTTTICERAGTTRGAMLHHYPTKAALVAGAIEQLFSERHDEFRSYLAAKVGAARRATSHGARELEPAVAALWRIYTGKTFYAWAELLVAARTDPELRTQLRKVDDRFFAQAVLTCTALLGLEEAPEHEVAALTRLLLSVLDGLALNHALGGRERIAGDVLATLPGMFARRRGSFA